MWVKNIKKVYNIKLIMNTIFILLTMVITELIKKSK